MLAFRNATADDVEVLSKLYSPKSVEQINNWRKIQMKRIKEANNNDKEFIVALQNGLIIGHVFIDYNKTNSHMKSLIVRENLRGKGIGSEIIKEVERRARNRGLIKIQISVNPDNNPHALRLYERLGYIQTDKEKYLEYVDPVDGAEDWVIDLEKILD